MKMEDVDEGQCTITIKEITVIIPEDRVADFIDDMEEVIKEYTGDYFFEWR